MVLGITIALVVVALFFDFTNGYHDAANAIATSVSTTEVRTAAAARRRRASRVAAIPESITSATRKAVPMNSAASRRVRVTG